MWEKLIIKDVKLLQNLISINWFNDDFFANKEVKKVLKENQLNKKTVDKSLEKTIFSYKFDEMF